MKTTAICVAFVVSALVIGCQESNFNNPVSTNSSGSTTMSKKAEVPDGFISLNQIVQRGMSADVAEQFQVSGQLQYTLVATDVKDVYTFSTTLNSEIFSLNNEKARGAISGERIENVVISPEKSFEVTKNYEVKDFDQLIRLYVTFSLTADKVVVARIWIEDDITVGIRSAK